MKCDLLLDGVTSTYFEGDLEHCEIAKRGYSRDSRGDRPQVCIGLVVTEEGFPLGYEVFAGNMHDSRTVKSVVESLERKHGALNRVWVMDRGMVSSDNLEFLRERGAKYIVGTPKSMLRAFEQQLTEQNWVETQAGVDGCYVLWTNLTGVDPATLWRRYIQLTEAEWAFRIAKDELAIRPVWHHKEDRVRSHVLVCFLAYAMWKTLAGWMKGAGLGDALRTLLYEIAKIKSGDIVLPAESSQGVRTSVRLRHVTEPEAEQKTLLHRLGLQLLRRLKRIDRPTQME
ncbi:MAG: IS1634 family transposase [Pirellulales bacterium]